MTTSPSDQQLTIDPELETWDEWFNHIPAFGGHDQPNSNIAAELWASHLEQDWHAEDRPT